MFACRSTAFRLSFLALAALAAGCSQAPSPPDAAKIASQALGIPVLVWSLPGDACVEQQIDALYSEFIKASQPVRDQLIAKFKTYKTIVVQPTDDQGAVSGDSYVLNLLHRVCRESALGQSCETEPARFVRIGADRLTKSGTVLGTSVVKVAQTDGSGLVLYITPQTAKNDSHSKVVNTRDASLYDVIRSSPSLATQMMEIESALRLKSAVLKSSKRAPRISCGKLATFSDL